MITIIADKYRYETPPASALMATQIADYIPVRQRIRRALDQNHVLVVYATDPVILGWLSDLQRYPESRLAWRVVDPSTTFIQLFGVPPKPPFTPARIAVLQLNQLPALPSGVFVEPLTWTLGHRLDPVWQHDDPPAGHIAALVEWAYANKQLLQTDMLMLVQAQLERWGEEQPIYHALHAATLADDSAGLLARWALDRYPEEWRKAQPWGTMPLMDSKPKPAVLAAGLHSEHLAIQTYWNRQMTSTSDGANLVFSALASMSGHSTAELNAIITMVSRHASVLNHQLLEAIQKRFALLPNAEQALHKLAERVAAPEPLLPDPAWPTERWLRWATQQYMPYFTRLIQRGGERNHQQACALAYSDWLYSQYPTWLNDDQSPLLLRQYQHMHTLIEDNNYAVVVWLIVDGMTWWQGTILRDMCERYGLYVQAQQIGIAVLPSVTSVSKRALVTGQPTIDLDQPTIAEAARVKLARSNILAHVGYKLEAATEVLRSNEQLQVAVVLFNMLDVLAHQTSDFTDNAGIRGYLDTLASELGSMQQVCSEQGRELHVLIGSDHGSTLLPHDAHSLTLPSRMREIDDVWEAESPTQEAHKTGTRAATTDLDHIPSVDTQTWYVLDRDRFHLDQHYLVPRGYTYIKRRPTTWTHGGLTPEETIVPLLHLASLQPRLLPIEIDPQGTLRVGQPDTITIVLRNLNPFPVQNILLSITGATEDLEVAAIGSLEQRELLLAFPAVHTKEAQLLAPYEVRYTAFGTEHHNTGHVRIALRRLQTEDTSFDNMFN